MKLTRLMIPVILSTVLCGAYAVSLADDANGPLVIGLATATPTAAPTATPDGNDAYAAAADGVMDAAETPLPEMPDVTPLPNDTLLTEASAKNAAEMLRMGDESVTMRHWLTAMSHTPNLSPLKDATKAMLRNAVGTGLTPVGHDGLRFQCCTEVPLPSDGQVLEKGVDYNIHGTVYTGGALLSMSATVTPKGDGKKQTAKVTFDPAAQITAWSIDSSRNTVEKTSLNELLRFELLAAGRYTLTIAGTSTEATAETQLYTGDFKVESVEKRRLNQNLFDDNWDEAYRFFGGDTEKFLFYYFPKPNEEGVSTETLWREKYLVESPLGRVHADALPYFEQANEYLETTYVQVSSTKYPNAPVMQLKTLIFDNNPGTYVPRFQKNMEFVSHHTLGTCADINEQLYPNTNHVENHALIGDDVRNCLTYDGIKTDEGGQQYYAFTYTGSYRGYTKRIPNTLANYLLYELAFYRAGFQWGYYYETTCDAMHFTLSETDYGLFMDTDRGMRKVYEYYN